MVAAVPLPAVSNATAAVLEYTYDPAMKHLGCSPLTLPYEATYDGRRALVLVHIRGRFNPAYAPTAAVPLTSSLSTVEASLLPGALFTANGTVVVVEVVRHAAEPAQAEISSLTLAVGHQCTPHTGDGLPTFNIELSPHPH